MRLLILSFFLMFAAMPAQSQTLHEDIIASVNGMICDFCAQSVLKIFEEKDAVNGIDVSLDDATVTIHQKPGQVLSDEEVQQAIYYAGYDLVGIERLKAEH